MEEELRDLREQLLAHRPESLPPGQGAEAFQQHKLLATTVHQASKLDEHAHENETGAWLRYLTSYFPAPRNSESDARVLWTDWRTSLLKRGAPGAYVLVTHGQPAAHWLRDGKGRLCIDLESMWEDFTASVSEFMAFLRTAPDRREVALDRAQRSHVVVEFVELTTYSAPASGWVGPPSSSTATTTGASAVAWSPPKRPPSA
jgi:hypothetical protein